MAPVSQMAVRINLKLSSATTTPPLSVCPAFHHNSCGNGRPGSTAHFHISVFLFIIFSSFFPSLMHSFELKISGSWNAQIFMIDMEGKREGRGHLDWALCWWDIHRIRIEIESLSALSVSVPLSSPHSLFCLWLSFSHFFPLSLFLSLPWEAADRPSHYPWSSWQHHGRETRGGRN